MSSRDWEREARREQLFALSLLPSFVRTPRTAHRTHSSSSALLSVCVCPLSRHSPASSASLPPTPPALPFEFLVLSPLSLVLLYAPSPVLPLLCAYPSDNLPMGAWDMPEHSLDPSSPVLPLLFHASLSLSLSRFFSATSPFSTPS